MKPLIGLTDEARTKVGQILNLLLADETVLCTTTRDYHWNVTGPEFASLHRQFGEQCELVAKWIDEVAERARALGVGARGNLADLAKSARTAAVPGVKLSTELMLTELLSLHEELIVRLRTDSATCTTRFKDVGTADFLTGLMEKHEKAAWMFRAQLEPVPTKAS